MVEKAHLYKPVNPNLQVAEKPSPFSGFFREPTAAEVRKMVEMNKAYLRWLATRRDNPFIEPQSATGFEGYFVGMGFEPEVVAKEIAKLGMNTLEAIRLMHRSDPLYIRKLNKVANGEMYDLSLIEELNSCLMANVARLRIQVHPQKNKAGDEFRSKVARMVQAEHIEYIEDEEQGVVTGHVLAIPLVGKQALAVTEGTFDDDKLLEGFEFMHLLGKAGYPLVQLALQRK